MIHWKGLFRPSFTTVVLEKIQECMLQLGVFWYFLALLRSFLSMFLFTTKKLPRFCCYCDFLTKIWAHKKISKCLIIFVDKYSHVSILGWGERVQFKKNYLLSFLTSPSPFRLLPPGRVCVLVFLTLSSFPWES